MLDSRTGKVIASVPIGRGVDAARFDPGTGLAFASNGEGTLTVVHQDSPDRLTVVATVPTARSARTMTLDPTTHRVYLSAADYQTSPADTGAARQRPRPVPGSFRVLVLGPGER
jgi:DNA-binding beta-propeller fold protein YncE